MWTGSERESVNEGNEENRKNENRVNREEVPQKKECAVDHILTAWYI